MTRFRSILRRPIGRGAVAFACILPLGGCMTWANRPTPAPSSNPDYETAIRLTRADGYAITLDHAVVQGDSIVGTAHGDRTRRVALALADVRRTEVHKLNEPRSLLAAMAVAAAVWAGYAVAVLTEPSG